MDSLTIVFDLDGTLVDTAPDLVAATNHVMNHLALPPITRPELERYVGHGALRMIAEAVASHGRPMSEPELYPLFDIFITHYTANIAAGSQPYDGVAETLTEFKAAGALLAVCTNKAERPAKMLLDALGLSTFFETIAGRDTYETYKPHPGHLLNTIASAKGDPRHAVMIGDSATDIATARAANIPVVAVSFGYTDIPVKDLAPDAIIDHYSELAAAINKVTAKVTAVQTVLQ